LPSGGSVERDAGWDFGLGLLAIAPVIVVGTLALIEGPLGRYWMPLIPTLLIWLGVLGGQRARVEPSPLPNRPPDRPPPNRPLICGASAGILLAMFAVSVVFTHDFLAWNQTRWRQAEAWLQAGLEPRDFDGGRDINAWLRSAEDPETRPRPGDTSPWWSGHARLCLAIGPRPGWREIDRLSWNAWATGRRHEILVLQRVSCHPLAKE
jgi:hypothetical protein